MNDAKEGFFSEIVSLCFAAFYPVSSSSNGVVWQSKDRPFECKQRSWKGKNNANRSSLIGDWCILLIQGELCKASGKLKRAERIAT